MSLNSFIYNFLETPLLPSAGWGKVFFISHGILIQANGNYPEYRTRFSPKVVTKSKLRSQVTDFLKNHNIWLDDKFKNLCNESVLVVSTREHTFYDLILLLIEALPLADKSHAHHCLVKYLEYAIFQHINVCDIHLRRRVLAIISDDPISFDYDRVREDFEFDLINEYNSEIEIWKG